jgi:hypothetical protein
MDAGIAVLESLNSCRSSPGVSYLSRGERKAADPLRRRAACSPNAILFCVDWLISEIWGLINLAFGMAEWIGKELKEPPPSEWHMKYKPDFSPVANSV